MRTLFRAGLHLERMAVRAWQIAPGNSTVTSKAYFLDGQLERVTGMAYTDNPRRDMIGGLELQHAPTRALLLRDVWLLDGALYKRNCRFDLYSRQQTSKAKRFFPTTGVRMEIDRASIYSSFDGNGSATGGCAASGGGHNSRRTSAPCRIALSVGDAAGAHL